MDVEDGTKVRARAARKRGRRSPFLDRADAGRELAQRLSGFKRRDDCIVLALPRGGVPVGFEVARRLGLPLDVLIARALGVPGHEEQTFGAVTAENGAVLDYALIQAARITQQQVSTALDGARAELKARSAMLRDGRKPLDVEGKAVILVSDGATTGACLFAGLHVLRRMRPAQVVVALPICPEAACQRLEREADLLLVLRRPPGFYAMAQFYLTFSTVTDEEVVQRLAASARADSPEPSGVPQPSTGLSGWEP